MDYVCYDCVSAVSYTHLDVYKRQLSDLVCVGRSLSGPVRDCPDL